MLLEAVPVFGKLFTSLDRIMPSMGLFVFRIAGDGKV